MIFCQTAKPVRNTEALEIVSLLEVVAGVVGGHHLHTWDLLFGRVIAQFVSFGLRQDAKKRRIAVRHPMPEGKTAYEDGDTREDGIEEIEGPHRADANEVEQCALDSQEGERLMQTLEDTICALLLLRLVWHNPRPKGMTRWRVVGSWHCVIRPRANSGHWRRERQCPFQGGRRPAPFLRRVRRARSRSRRSRWRSGSRPSLWCR